MSIDPPFFAIDQFAETRFGLCQANFVHLVSPDYSMVI